MKREVATQRDRRKILGEGAKGILSSSQVTWLVSSKLHDNLTSVNRFQGLNHHSLLHISQDQLFGDTSDDLSAIQQTKIIAD
jgi:hypothetical protein